MDDAIDVKIEEKSRKKVLVNPFDQKMNDLTNRMEDMKLKSSSSVVNHNSSNGINYNPVSRPIDEGFNMPNNRDGKSTIADLNDPFEIVLIHE